MRPRSWPIGRVAAQQVLRGHRPEAANKRRLDDLQLAVEVLAAGGRLDRQRRAIAGRAAAEDVQDVDVLAAHLHALDDDVGEQLAGPAHERLATPIFVGAGRLAAKDQPRIGISHAKDRLDACAGQLAAALTGGHLPSDGRQGRHAGIALSCGRGSRGGGRLGIPARRSVACAAHRRGGRRLGIPARRSVAHRRGGARRCRSGRPHRTALRRGFRRAFSLRQVRNSRPPHTFQPLDRRSLH